jgi:hypothetical protein
MEGTSYYLDCQLSSLIVRTVYYSFRQLRSSRLSTISDVGIGEKKILKNYYVYLGTQTH